MFLKRISLIIKRALFLFLLGLSCTAFAQPNFIFILTDDMTPDEFRFMPRTQEYFAVNGIRFTNAFVTQGVCCPARVTFMTGRYAKNTGIKTNVAPDGGFEGFIRFGLESETIAAKLQAAGYSTAYFGKFLNGYGGSVLVPFNYVPAGWSHWYTLLRTIKYYNYALNENGQIVSYGNSPADYATDVIANHAVNHLGAVLQGNSPFFMMISPFAPHVTTSGEDMAIPAPRHLNLFEGLTAPRAASFNQADVSKKPWSVRTKPLLLPDEIARIDSNFRARVQSLQAVDEMIGNLIDQLRNHPKMQETYLIFVSDNGYWFGEHRLPKGKGGLYDQSHRVPIAISGPNVKQGLVRDDLVLNTDIFPTILSLADVQVPWSSYDGRSLRPLLETSERLSGFYRNSFLIETAQDKRNGIRFGSYVYLETPEQNGTMFKELYDTQLDPDLVYNLAERLTADSSTALADALSQLRDCSGNSCRKLENAITSKLVKFVD